MTDNRVRRSVLLTFSL